MDKKLITEWEPTAEWLLVTPTTLPDKTEAGIFLPDTFTNKNTSGIVFATGHEMNKDLIGMEVFFPRHCEYQIVDSDTDKLFYVVPHDKIILTRKLKAKPKFVRVGDQHIPAQRPIERSL